MVSGGGTAVVPEGAVRADIGIRGETIAAIGDHLGPGAAEIDASGQLVMPGGIDPHAHIEQVSGGGLLNADSFESGTTSAAFGGTTPAIPFAAQHVGLGLDRAVAPYHALPDKAPPPPPPSPLLLPAPHQPTPNPHSPTL